MLDSRNYIKKLMTHLEDSITDLPNGVEIKTKFPNSYISYPLTTTTLVLGCKNIDFATVSSTPSGVLTINIGIYTTRDRGSTAHQDIIDQVLAALCSFSGFTISAISVDDSKFDRTNSALLTNIACTVNFGQ